MNDQRKRKLKQLNAAERYVRRLVAEADYFQGGYYPMWYGWALRDAFHAGVRFAKADAARRLK